MPKKDKGGRPTVFTPTVLQKLQDAFLLGCTDSEACAYAEIARSSLANYQNEHPEFLDKKEEWKEAPFLKARKTIINDLRNAETARWFMERKRKDEFSNRQELTGAGGKDLGNLVIIKNGDTPK